MQPTPARPADSTGPAPGTDTVRTPLRAAVAVLAGGSGTRVGAGINKVYLPLAGRSVISWSFVWAGRLAEVVRCVLVVRPQDAAPADRVLRGEVPAGPPVEVVPGGATRHGSEESALAVLAPAIRAGELDVVVVHDGARPLSGPGLFRTTIATAAQVGGAVPTLPATGLLPLPGPDDAAARELVPPGHHLARVQTPQAFRAADLLAAYDRARADGFEGTDTAATVQRYGSLTVRAVPGSRHNLKVTYPHDLQLAERLLAAHDYRMP